MFKRTRTNHSDIRSKVSLLSLVTGEMKPDNGEDAFGYSFNENGGILATYDGCGGLGARRYEAFQSKTGAYIASRVVGKAVLGWFQRFSWNKGRVNEQTMGQIIEELSREMVIALGEFKGEEMSGGSRLKRSDLVRELPTTVSLVLFDYLQVQNAITAAFIWAGDSRGYVLTEESGLGQITIDDLTGDHDAFDNLFADSRLSNVVAADGRFHLHHRLLSLEAPFVAISATDGCFAYLQTPMEFEYMMLEALYHANNPTEWEERMEFAMRKVAGDDFSLGIAAFGYDDFEELKKGFERRTIHLHEKYITMLANATGEEKREMWLDYKKDYNRWLD